MPGEGETLGAEGGVGLSEHQMNIAPELILVRKCVCPAVLAASLLLVLERQQSIWQGCWPCKPALQWLILWFVFKTGCQLKRWQMAHSADLCVCCPVPWNIWFQQKVQVLSFSFPYHQEGEGYSHTCLCSQDRCCGWWWWSRRSVSNPAWKIDHPGTTPKEAACDAAGQDSG